MSTNREIKKKAGFSALDRIEQLHPYKTFMFFGIVGSTLLFLSMAFLYLVSVSKSGTPHGFQFPKIFSLSTVLLMISSFSILGAIKAFKEDNFIQLKIALTGTLVIGLLFCATQTFGWIQMLDGGFFIKSNVGISYLYIITGIHFMHITGGIIYLAGLNYTVYNNSRDVAKSLMYLTDNLQLTKLQLFTIYWHFMDALWILLFFMFLFTF